jgi:RNA-directed DNA polymerase
MRLETSVIKQLDLATAAERQLTRGLDRFPPLIVDRCLQDSIDVVTRHAASTYIAGAAVPSEVLTMPRKKFGLRPVVATSAACRILYSAIVATIDDALSEPTRASGNWDKHQHFGFDNVDRYAVDLDIASYYEYIEHGRLEEELILRSSNVLASQSLTHYLHELIGRSRGVPQMQYASDRLADTYLSILDRQLARRGYDASRYVDDIRVLANDWTQANLIIEEVAEAARELGLILSTEKTFIYRIARLIEQEEESNEFFDTYFAQARDALTSLMIIGAGEYEGSEVVEIAPDDKEAAQAATWRIYHEWWTTVKDKDEEANPSPQMAKFVTSRLAVLYDYGSRLEDGLLKDLVFQHPTTLDQIARYIIARSHDFPHEDSLASIEALATMGRQSPWAKLWLLHAVETVATWPPLDPWSELGMWIEQQLGDRHEIIRAQAAWLCSNEKGLSSERLAELYVEASPVTQAALAACGTNQGNISSSVLSGITGDSPLNRAAATWAKNRS